MTVAYGFVLLRWILYFEVSEVQELLVRFESECGGAGSWLTTGF
jgi:hypothetical protein